MADSAIPDARLPGCRSPPGNTIYFAASLSYRQYSIDLGDGTVERIGEQVVITISTITSYDTSTRTAKVVKQCRSLT